MTSLRWGKMLELSRQWPAATMKQSQAKQSYEKGGSSHGYSLLPRASRLCMCQGQTETPHDELASGQRGAASAFILRPRQSHTRVQTLLFDVNIDVV